MIKKSLKDISWLVSEKKYRDDPAYSYSTIAKFDREGFDKLSNLFDKTESPSLLFGSCVDTLLTDGQEAFDERFFVADFPEISDNVKKIVDILFVNYSGTYNNMDEIPNKIILPIIDEQAYQTNWKPETRCKVIKEKGCEYYGLKYLASDKTIITTALYQDVLDCVDVLKTSEATKWYFMDDNPFDDIERLYQLKFKGEYEGIDLRIMADEIIVNHDTKEIIPCDLKTTKSVLSFNHSFYQWRYYIQAQLYSYILQQVIEKDDYFKDFTISDYKFIAIDKYLKYPVVYSYNGNFRGTSLINDEGEEKENWRSIVKQLDWYLKHPECVIYKEMLKEIEATGEVRIKQYE